MNTSPDTHDKITPEPLVRNRLDILIWAVIAIQLGIAIYGYIVLPDTVPIHWGIDGRPNGYGPKWVDTFLFPLINLGLYVLLKVVLLMGPRLGGPESQAANRQVRNMLLAALILFMLVIQLVVLSSTLGMSFNAIVIINLGVSVLFIFLGNYMGKLRRNFWMGIRTPWTLSSDLVWERTHRVGGWLFVAVGLLGILFSFVPPIGIWGFIALLLLMVVFLFVYSYLCYRRLPPQQGDPFEEIHQD